MFKNNKQKKQIKNTIQTKQQVVNATAVSCRRKMVERRVANMATSFPLVDTHGAKVNKDRRWRPDRRYDVEIQWLRG